ncbi:MAG: hypothetical protein QM817_11210 [Archangium sp.]
MLLSACQCKTPELQTVTGLIRVQPEQVDFGLIVLGGAGASTITLTNTGKVALEGQWALTGEGFRINDGFPSRAEVGDTQFVVSCAPDHAGLFDGAVTITFSGYAPLVIPLACEAVPAPECTPSGPCRTSSWDVAAARCVEVELDDGRSCSLNDVCLVAPSCHQGRCEGTLRDCNDADPCTADTCDPARGCEHLGPVSCPAQGACRVGVCTSGVGCGLDDAPDGTPCGPKRGCMEAEVCISGACVVRDPPDGFACASDGPCGGAGRCVNDECVIAAANPLTPTWTLGDLQTDGGFPPESWSDLIADRSGRYHLSSYFMSPPRLDAKSAMPVNLTQLARRCVMWLGWLVCGDLPGLATSPVSAIDPTTGTIVWSFTGVQQEIAEFNGPRVEFFTARLAVMNEQELLVLYESRTMTPEGRDPRCRVFAMVVLDRAGQAVASRFINDPIFGGTCNHQHSYGVAVDAQSNIYLGFTASSTDNPAATMTGTTIFSFSPSLQPRWRVHDASLAGGELAVANGLLFQENTNEVRSSMTGTTVATFASRFGGGIVGDGVAVQLDQQNRTVEAISTSGTHPVAWTYTLRGQPERQPLFGAKWASPWGEREVALAITNDQGQVRLEGIELITGAKAFDCPLSVSEVPIAASVTQGGLGLMFGVTPAADSCANCDPRYARTKNRFAFIPLPTLSPSDAPWPATWGNEGHTHHEGR